MKPYTLSFTKEDLKNISYLQEETGLKTPTAVIAHALYYAAEITGSTNHGYYYALAGRDLFPHATSFLHPEGIAHRIMNAPETGEKKIRSFRLQDATAEKIRDIRIEAAIPDDRKSISYALELASVTTRLLRDKFRKTTPSLFHESSGQPAYKVHSAFDNRLRNKFRRAAYQMRKRLGAAPARRPQAPSA